jgi:hypothetical protein
MDNGIEPSTGDVHPCSVPTAHNLQYTLTALILTLHYTAFPSSHYRAAAFSVWIN